ncbi:MAG: permease [Candidatus Omnitrophica bacterium]|nr:permease [Candidatus Omnitrophota bacterium]
MMDFVLRFYHVFAAYFVETVPALFLGLIISGLIHEFVSDEWVVEHMGGKGIKPIIYATLVGAVVPVCCWGSLPIAVSFHKKGASLGPVFAFLVATPATSINAVLVAWRILGLGFTLYVFIAVIIIGIIMGIIGDSLGVKTVAKEIDLTVGHDHEKCTGHCECKPKDLSAKGRTISILKYAFIDMPKEIGLETLAGIAMASLVATISPIGLWIKSHLARGLGYVFAVAFGLIVYMCATMSIPLVDAFIKQGLNAGAGVTLLILGPIVSYGTILVLRKEFGSKVLAVFVISISVLCVLAGYGYQLAFFGRIW